MGLFNKAKVRVLVVDDSPIIRSVFRKMLNASGEVDVVGVAEDPYEAQELIIALEPDVMTLDLQMPKLDGLSFLERLMEHYPIPTIVISSFSQKGSKHAFDALELGAVEALSKPTPEDNMGLWIRSLIEKIKAAALVPRQQLGKKTLMKATKISSNNGKFELLAIGSSTGGPQALEAVIPYLPAYAPPVIIVQHMPPIFTASLAARLDHLSPLHVKEAVHGEPLEAGKVLIAPGGRHLEVQKRPNGLFVSLSDGPKVHAVKPAVDVTFFSIAKTVGAKTAAVILTGMGEDGAEGLLRIKEAGGSTIAQDEASSVVYGMPKMALKFGGVQQVLPLQYIAGKLSEWISS